MAMSLRPIRPEQPVRRQSQNFRPQADWRDEEGATILLVYLPGFVKEQIRTTYDEPRRSVRVQGERRLPNNRRMRIDERYSVPENCEGSKMETQFGRGILMVTLPKTKPELEPEPEARKPEETTSDLKIQKGEEEMVPATSVGKQAGGDIHVEVASSGKTTRKLKSQAQTAGEDTSSKTTPTKKETGQYQIPAQAGSTSDSQKQIDEGNVRQESGEKKERGEIEKYEKIKETVQGKERESKESAVQEEMIAKAEKKEKEKITERSGNDSGDAKAGEKKQTAEKPGDDSGDAASAKKGPVIELNEDGNPLVNTVVAALVILGLVTCYFYSFGI